MKDEVNKDSFEYGGYAWFHFANKGKEFKTPEGIKTKLEIWQKNKKNTGYLELITENRVKDIIAINKSGWTNGIFTNWIEWDGMLMQIKGRKSIKGRL